MRCLSRSCNCGTTALLLPLGTFEARVVLALEFTQWLHPGGMKAGSWGLSTGFKINPHPEGRATRTPLTLFGMHQRGRSEPGVSDEPRPPATFWQASGLRVEPSTALRNLAALRLTRMRRGGTWVGVP